MKTAFYEFKFGILQIVYQNEILYELKILKNSENCSKDSNFIEKNEKSDFSDKVLNEIEEYIKNKRKTFTIKYKFEGTEFQRKVWHELEKIPYGETRTYLSIAKNIGNAKAVRAIGGACNKNPIWLIVPCHRVIGSNGSLTGYEGGLALKEKLLDIEKIKK